jgi:small-conductance mechanosensitive channel
VQAENPDFPEKRRAGADETDFSVYAPRDSSSLDIMPFALNFSALEFLPPLPAVLADTENSWALKDIPHDPIDLFFWIINHNLITLGKVDITLVVLFKLVVLGGLVLVGERVLRRFFTQKVLKRTALDAGAQYSIARISGYIIIVFGFYLALNAVGLSLTSLAVVAGAIGIGIGFGLQNIIQNFISGIIILAERPIALGDRVEVGGVAGTIAKINLRSTEIISNDNITTIVPNSNFITNPVTNWSHGDPRVQMRIPIGVAYSTDIDKLKRLLTEVAEENADALRDPHSTVYFVAFGDSSLNFELGVWTKSMTHSPRRFTSDLNFAIERKLRENKIEIPFPQRDLHIRGTPPASLQNS